MHYTYTEINITNEKSPRCMINFYKMYEISEPSKEQIWYDPNEKQYLLNFIS